MFQRDGRCQVQQQRHLPQIKLESKSQSRYIGNERDVNKWGLDCTCVRIIYKAHIVMQILHKNKVPRGEWGSYYIIEIQFTLKHTNETVQKYITANFHTNTANSHRAMYLLENKGIESYGCFPRRSGKGYEEEHSPTRC